MHKISQKVMPLDPEAYKYEPEPHRLWEHMDSHPTPWSNTRVPNPQDSGQLEDNYKGVHGTEDIRWAAAYANNRAAEGDPPVVIEFATNQQWVNDVDAKKDMNSQLEFATEQVLEIEGLREAVNRMEASDQVDGDYIAEIFQEVSAMEYADMYDWESSYDDTVGDELQRSSVRITADAITDFFSTYYPDDPITAFYQGFLRPVIMGGDVDERLYGHFYNQMRFLEAIKDEIVRVHRVTPWEDEVYNRWDEEGESGEYLEEREKDGVTRRLIDQEELLYFSPQTEVIWESPEQKPGQTFYHGTSLSRAQKALPFLRGLS